MHTYHKIRLSANFNRSDGSTLTGYSGCVCNAVNGVSAFVFTHYLALPARHRSGGKD